MAATKKTIKVRVLKSLAGTYLLPYYVGEKIEVEHKLATQMIETGHVMSENDALKLDAENKADSKTETK